MAHNDNHWSVTWEGQIKATILSQSIPEHSLAFNDIIENIIDT